MIVSPSVLLGDATCPHCGALIFPKLQGDNFDRDDEKRLADLGVIVETDDEGEVVTAELHGPRFNDRTVHKLTGCNGIPIIKICNTGLSRRGNKRLRELLPNSIVRRNLIKFQSHFYGLDHPRCGRIGPVAC